MSVVDPAGAQPSLAEPGAFLAGWRQVTITRPNSTTFTARLFYPGQTAGSNAALDAAGAPYPAVSFGHGFFQAVSTYQSTLEHLATHGYIVIATESEGGLAPSHANFATDLSHSLTYLEQQHATAGSLLFGAVHTARYGVGGHSMGGGAAILAAASDTRIDAVFGLAAADTNPSSIGAIANVRVPVRLLAGSSDTIVSAAGTTQPMYANARAPKQYALLAGGYHCGFQDSSFPIGCDTGMMSRADQLALTRRLLTEWCNVYLKGDEASWAWVWGASAPGEARITLARDAGVAIVAGSPTARGLLGRTAVVRVTVRNTGAPTQAFAVRSSGAWWGVASPAVTAMLAAGQSADVDVVIGIPQGASPNSAVMTLTARSELDGGTRAFAFVTVSGLCPADLDDGNASGVPDGGVTIDDLLFYLGLFEQGVVRADTDDGTGTGTPDGGVTIDDLLYYLVRFEAGC
jgi:predicted dienelactone hydrolase